MDNKKKSSCRKHMAITFAVMAFIFIHSAMPGDVSGSESGFFVNLISALTGLKGEMLSFAVRKFGHFSEFTALGLCLAVNVKDLGHNRIWIPAWITGSLYAVTDELHQIFVPMRSCQFLDICIDSAGVAVGAFIMCIILLKRGR